jgi:thiamine-monophosphate kinase
MSAEFSLIQRYFTRPTPEAILGPGDDCALLAPTPGMQLAVTTDMLVSGTHFYPDADPEKLGWKAVAVNLSDLAAMGAKPRWITLAGSLPQADEAWLEAFAKGLFACAARFGVQLVGGDTTQGPLNLCLTALGEVAPGRALRRDGAAAGDDIWISGRPGLAGLGLAHLQGRVVLPELWQRLCLGVLHKPQPRVDLGLALAGLASAAIDVSDGLLADLGHILERSGLQAEIQWTQLPHLPQGVEFPIALECQLAGGDDYELCFTAPPDKRLEIAAIATALELPLWRIGSTLLAAEGEVGQAKVLDANGALIDIGKRGFEHFNTGVTA